MVAGTRRLLGAWLGLLLGLAPTLASDAIAAGTCSGNRANYHNGLFTFNVNTWGSTAVISTEWPSLCSGQQSFSGAWTMIAGPNAGGWAQSGYVREALIDSTKLFVFSQYRRATGAPPVTKFFSPGPPNDAVRSYTSQYNSGTRRIDIYYEDQRLDTTNFDPTLVWSQPWSSQWSEETGHCQTDVPGLVVDKVHYTVVRQQLVAGGGWESPAGAEFRRNCGTKYATQRINATAFDAWTQNP